ncbi:CHAP domain-containing protein, partial [Streptococcus suis]
QNTSFKRQDVKAQKLAEGTLDVSSEGGVYFTDTSGSGKRRAEIMEALNDWIDTHGGTPEAPSELIETSGSATLQSVPASYALSKKINVSNYISQTYPWGQC